MLCFVVYASTSSLLSAHVNIFSSFSSRRTRVYEWVRPFAHFFFLDYSYRLRAAVIIIIINVLSLRSHAVCLCVYFVDIRVFIQLAVVDLLLMLLIAENKYYVCVSARVCVWGWIILVFKAHDLFLNNASHLSVCVCVCMCCCAPDFLSFAFHFKRIICKDGNIFTCIQCDFRCCCCCCCWWSVLDIGVRRDHHAPSSFFL